MFKSFFLVQIFFKYEKESERFAWKMEETISLQLKSVKINLNNQARCSQYLVSEVLRREVTSQSRCVSREVFQT